MFLIAALAISLSGLALVIGYHLRLARRDLSIRLVLGGNVGNVSRYHAAKYARQTILALLAAVPLAALSHAFVAEAVSPLSIGRVLPGTEALVAVALVSVGVAWALSSAYVHRLDGPSLRETLASN